MGKSLNNGYIEVMMPEHPYARSNGTVLEHRLVAEEKLGRYLKPTEVVHHLDENKTNNSQENLIVFRTTTDHSRFHKTGLFQDMGDGTYICPAPKIIAKCKYCKKYYVKTKNKRKNTYCSNNCYRKMCEETFKNRTDRPSKELLAELVQKFPFTKIGEMYNVSDNTVRKWCKKFDIKYKYRDIHPKKENTKKKRYLLKDYKIKMTNDEIEIIHQNIDEAIKFIKENCTKNNIPDKSVRDRIGNAIKHDSMCYGYNWCLISNKTETPNAA